MRGRIIGWTGGLMLTGAAAMYAAAGAAAQQPAPNNAPAARATDPRAETLRRLEKRVTIDMVETPIEDVFVFIEQVADIDIDVLWREGSRDGLDKDARITLNMRDGTLMSILERTLDQAKRDYSSNTWQFTQDGVLEVGPKDVLNQKSYVKLYDVADLVFVVPNFPNVPELDLDTVLQQSSQRGGGGGGGGIFQDPEDVSIDDILNEEAQATMQLMDIITQTIEPEQWDTNGGDGASMRIYKEQLLVRAPDYIQRQIGGYDFMGGRRAGSPPARKVSSGPPLNAPAPATEKAKDAPSTAPRSPDDAQ